MKDFLYLDTNLVNSYLAQIDSGLLQKMVSGKESTESHTEDGGKEITMQGGGKIGIPAVAEANSHVNKKEIDTFSEVFTSKNSELLETALHDYSFDILYNRMRDEEMINFSRTFSAGDIISSSGKVHIINFEQLYRGSVRENVSAIHHDSAEVIAAREEIKKLEGKGKKPVPTSEKGKMISDLKEFVSENQVDTTNFDNIANFGKYGNVLFPDTFLVKINNTISFCSNNSLRMNVPSLTMSGVGGREATIVGVVMSKKEDSLVPTELMPTDEIVRTAPAVQMDIVLSSFDVVLPGDFYIRPIAIYFQTNDTN